MINGLGIIEIINKLAEVMEKNKSFLTELDAAIGDGDHGLNMAKGFQAVTAKIRDDDGKNIGDILKKVGMTLVSTVGGASGPLYGTAFMKASVVANGKEEISIEDFINMMTAAIEGIKMRGKGEAGDKTMLDALIPALEALIKAQATGKSSKAALEEAKKAAYTGVEFTKTIAAKKGRASYLGDRSIGHQDPGATSSALMLEVIYNSL